MKIGAMQLTTFLASVATIILTTSALSWAAPDLMVYPTRVVMTDRQRAAQVDIVNTSQVQATYKITLVRKRMTETGEFQDVVTPIEGEKFADEVVKYSPRQVTLLPGATQTVRMMFKVPPGMQEGEYRSHLLFTKPPAAITEVPDKGEASSGAISMQIVANVGVSIPVIVRHGNLQASTAIEPASVKVAEADSKQILTFTLDRTGSRSIYGDVTVFREKDKIAEGKGYAVYTPNDRRKITLNVADSSHIKPGDKLRILFVEKDGGKANAETSVVIR